MVGGNDGAARKELKLLIEQDIVHRKPGPRNGVLHWIDDPDPGLNPLLPVQLLRSPGQTGCTRFRGNPIPVQPVQPVDKHYWLHSWLHSWLHWESSATKSWLHWLDWLHSKAGSFESIR